MESPLSASPCHVPGRAYIRAYNFLSDQIVLRMKDAPRGEVWLKTLDQEPCGRLLILCIALDLQVGTVSLDGCLALLDALPPSSGHACEEFMSAADKLDLELRNKSASATLVDRNAEYVRVLEIGNFLRFYTPLSGRGLNSEAIDEVRQMYFGHDAVCSFGDITQVWSGNRQRVWVLAKPDFDEIKKTSDELLDALGLVMWSGNGPNGGPDLVAVHYPADCPDLQPRQPTSLDPDWRQEHVLYVSYGPEDGWGRTHSLTGRTDQSTGESVRYRERIHGPYKSLTSAFYGEYVGEAKVPNAIDLSHVVKDAENRYDYFIRP